MSIECTLIFCLVAIPVTITDLREKRIPDVYSLGGLVFLFLLVIVFRGADFPAVLLSAAVGFLAFLLLRFVTGGNLGWGDVKYSAFIAAALGLRGWQAAVFISSVAGLCFSLFVLFSGRYRKGERIPFAPFLSFGAFSVLLIEAGRYFLLFF